MFGNASARSTSHEGTNLVLFDLLLYFHGKHLMSSQEATVFLDKLP